MLSDWFDGPLKGIARTEMQFSGLDRRNMLENIRGLDGGTVRPPAGMPKVAAGLELPSELADFYTLCGGLSFFNESLFPFEIVGPAEFEPANLVILGLGTQDDRSDYWYVVATSGGDQFVSIDLHPERMGRCYDSYVDRHAVAGSCAVVAASFAEFLDKTIEYGGRGLYWLDPKFKSLGDAYD